MGLGVIFWGGTAYKTVKKRVFDSASVSTMALEATAIGPAQFFECNDKVRLKYTDVGPRTAPALVLLHGWSANGNWFVRNVPELAKDLRVITVDHRGMGESDKPGHGHRVCRLSADVRDLLVHLEGTAALSQKVVLCGCSLGFTIICLYLELFGDAKIAGVAFVDQSAASTSSTRDLLVISRSSN